MGVTGVFVTSVSGDDSGRSTEVRPTAPVNVAAYDGRLAAGSFDVFGVSIDNVLGLWLRLSVGDGGSTITVPGA